MNWSDKDFVLEQVAQFGSHVLQKASDELKDDKEFMMAVINKISWDSDVLQYASKRLKSDRELVFFAISKNPDFYIHISDNLKKNKDIVVAILSKTRGVTSSVVLDAIPKQMFNDKDIVTILLQKNIGMGFQILSLIPKQMFHDRNILDLALNLSGEALNFAPDEIKNDPEVALKSISQSNYSFRYIGDKLKDDEEFMAKAMEIDRGFLSGASMRIKMLYLKPNTFTIKVGVVKLTFISSVTKEQVILFKTSLFKAMMKINTSKVPSFYKVLKDVNIIIGNISDNKRMSKVMYEEGSAVIAFFDPTIDMVFYNLDNTSTNTHTVYETLIHELAHRLHDVFIKNGLENEDITKLYAKATNSVEECRLGKFPKIGDPLSNLNVDKENNWSKFVYKKANTEFYLEEIRGNDFVYRNNIGQEKTLSKNLIMQMIKCPSIYGSKNRQEFFAEMCTMITLGVVKPNQEMMANVFMSLVKKNLK